MNIDIIKVELIDWIAQLNDQQVINKVLTLKKASGVKKRDLISKIYGSGKHLVEFVADDFNDPVDMFREYQK